MAELGQRPKKGRAQPRPEHHGPRRPAAEVPADEGLVPRARAEGSDDLPVVVLLRGASSERRAHGRKEV